MSGWFARRKRHRLKELFTSQKRVPIGAQHQPKVSFLGEDTKKWRRLFRSRRHLRKARVGLN